MTTPPQQQCRILTCWLIKTMPMSFLSWVNRSKADSTAAVSVLLSTTRKFFCASAPAVTCCCAVSGRYRIRIPLPFECKLTPMPARSSPVTESWSTSVVGWSIAEARQSVTAPGRGTNLVANHGEELPVLVVCLRSHLGDFPRLVVDTESGAGCVVRRRRRSVATQRSTQEAATATAPPHQLLDVAPLLLWLQPGRRCPGTSSSAPTKYLPQGHSEK